MINTPKSAEVITRPSFKPRCSLINLRGENSVLFHSSISETRPCRTDWNWDSVKHVFLYWSCFLYKFAQDPWVYKGSKMYNHLPEWTLTLNAKYVSAKPQMKLKLIVYVATSHFTFRLKFLFLSGCNTVLTLWLGLGTKTTWLWLEKDHVLA